jgi:CheY-like chemotaxis protein
MLIDDNKIDLFVSQKTIEILDPNVEFKTFTKATSAIAYLKILDFVKDFNTLFVPNVILLDINMPEMNGFQFLRELEQINIVKKHYIDIFMLSSSSCPQDVIKAKNHKLCKDYFNKPLTTDILKEIVYSTRRTA